MEKAATFDEVFEGAKEAGRKLAEALVRHAVSERPDNYTGMTFEFERDSGERGEVLIMVQFLDGKTPHELRLEAEKRADDLNEALAKTRALLGDVHVVGYARSEELDEFARSRDSYNTIGMDHPSIWVEDPPYDHLEPLCRGVKPLTFDEERAEFEKLYPLEKGVFWREELGKRGLYAKFVDSKENPHWGAYGAAFQLNGQFDVWIARAGLGSIGE